jgi:Dullard-like phosphatase family protein
MNCKIKYFSDVLKKKDNANKKATVVLDLDETLIYSSIDPKNSSYDFMMNDQDHKQYIFVFQRPGLRYFLESVSLFFDLAVFTASYSCYCNPILDSIETQTKIPHRFYNTSLVPTFTGLQKDLNAVASNRLPRSLIMIDNSPGSIITSQRENLYLVEPFCGQDEDDELITLVPFLIAMINLKDVRSILHRRNRFEERSY